VTAAKKTGKKSPAKMQNRGRKTTGTGKKKEKKPAPAKKEQTSQKKMGRPPVPYDPARHPEWVRGLASRGATRPEIVTALGISNGTLNAWKEKYPDFLAALQIGRNETIARLHNSLVKRAMGYTYEEKKTIKSDLGTERIEVTVKEVVADVGAAKILLVNLDPQFKTDRTQAEHTGDLTLRFDKEDANL
jgi:hypothetical protein